MTRSLFATMGFGESVQIRRVPMDASMQALVAEIFDTQERQLLAGVENHTLFDGRYTPDEDTLLYLDDLVEAAAMVQAIEGNSIAYQVLSEADLHSGDVRSLFSGERRTTGASRISVQNFQRTQVLRKGRTFLLSTDTYHGLQDSGLTLANSITCVVDGARTLFRHFPRAKRIFDLREVYKVATTPEVKDFCQHPALFVSDIDAFVSSADQTMRKKISQIATSEVLDHYPTETIKAAADDIGFALEIDDDRIVVPLEKGKAKLVLNFLDDGIYRSHFTDQLYSVNSRRKVE